MCAFLGPHKSNHRSFCSAFRSQVLSGFLTGIFLSGGFLSSLSMALLENFSSCKSYMLHRPKHPKFVKIVQLLSLLLLIEMALSFSFYYCIKNSLYLRLKSTEYDSRMERKISPWLFNTWDVEFGVLYEFRMLRSSSLP